MANDIKSVCIYTVKLSVFTYYLLLYGLHINFFHTDIHLFNKIFFGSVKDFNIVTGNSQDILLYNSDVHCLYECK